MFIADAATATGAEWVPGACKLRYSRFWLLSTKNKAERDAKLEEAKRRARLPRKQRLALEQKEKFDQDTADKLSAAKLGLSLADFLAQREKEEAEEKHAWEQKFGLSRDEVLNPKATRKTKGKAAAPRNKPDAVKSAKKAVSKAKNADAAARDDDDDDALMTPEQIDEQKVRSQPSRPLRLPFDFER